MATRASSLERGAEFEVAPQLERGTLRLVLEAYAARMPGIFLYYPSRRQASPAFRAFIELVRAHTGTGRTPNRRT